MKTIVIAYFLTKEGKHVFDYCFSSMEAAQTFVEETYTKNISKKIIDKPHVRVYRTKGCISIHRVEIIQRKLFA